MKYKNRWIAIFVIVIVICCLFVCFPTAVAVENVYGVGTFDFGNNVVTYVTIGANKEYRTNQSVIPTFSQSGFTSDSLHGIMRQVTYSVDEVQLGENTYSKNEAIPLTSLTAGTYSISAKITCTLTYVGQGASEKITRTVRINISVTNSYSVVFDLNGGERVGGGTLNQSVKYGKAATEPICTRKGYSFAGWDKSFDYITDDIVITAKWIDDIAPVGNIYTIDNQVVDIPIITGAFMYKADDNGGSGVATLQYKLPGSVVWQMYANGQVIALPSDGIYSFRAIDVEGNVSLVTNIEYVSDSLQLTNAALINRNYKLTSWYNVVLPARVFGVAESYSLENYQIALAYAKYRERQQRVTEIDDGWIYVSVANENVAQIYTDGAVLDAAITKYASTYVSEEQHFANGNNKYYTPINSNFEVDLDAMNTDQPKLPSFLLEDYSNIKMFLCRMDYSFTTIRRNDVVITSSISIKYIANDYAEQQGDSKKLANGSTLASIYGQEMAQGYYLVTETTTMNVDVQYIIYVDRALPTVKIEIQQGNGLFEQIDLDEEYIEIYGKALRYIDLKILSLDDNIDQYLAVQISGRNMSGIYTDVEDIPVLSYDNGYYGTYTIKIYDRSGNELAFDVIIAGKLPSLTHSSLSSESKLTLYINLNDNNNALTEIIIYKVSNTGEKHQLLVDDDGTNIDVANLTYVLRNGGKYTVQVTDLYGRTIELGTFFYEKGMPTGQLIGVVNGGSTNKTVSLVYSTDYDVKLYQLIDNNWQQIEVNIGTYDDTKKKATLETIQGMVGQYKFYLYNLSNEDLFVEYFFTVKCILPQVTIMSDSEEVLQGKVITGSSFYVTWSDNNITVYYWRQSGLGELSKVKYVKESNVSIQDTYHFVVTDEVGNTTEFDVKLDNTVSYTIDGNYTLIDGIYNSKYYLCVTATEIVSEFSCENTINIEVKSGDRIDRDGTYTYTIVDPYGNSVTLTCRIDKTPPQPTIILEDGGVLDLNEATNKPFSIVTDEKATITWKLNSGSSYTYNNEKFSEEGVYSFVAKDQLGNSTSFSVTITFAVIYNVKGSAYVIDNTYYSNDYLLLIANDATLNTVSNNGLKVENNTKVVEEGVYTVTITTNVGNTKTIIFIIDKTAPALTLLDSTENIVENGEITRFAVRAEWTEEDVTVLFKIGISNNKTYTGEWLTDAGDYTFTIADKLGNKAIYTLSIKTSIDYTVSGDYTQMGGFNYISNSYVIITLADRAEITVETESDNGIDIKLGEKIQIEGTYVITLTDVAGNVAYICVLIDKTPPKINASVTNGERTNKNVEVSIEENCSIECLYNNMPISIENIVTFAEHGNYILTVTDIAGNTDSISFELDKQVDIEVSGLIVNNQIITNSVSFILGESLTTTVTKDGEFFEYKDTVSDVGKYIFVFTDKLGNTRTVAFDIVSPTAREHTIDVPDGYSVVAKLNGQQIDIDASNGNIVLDVQGEYVLTFTNDVNVFELKLRIKNTPPNVNLVHDGDYIRVEEVAGEEEIEIVLERDGKVISYQLGETLTVNGNYVLTVTDLYGNVATYIFTINYINVYGKVVISIAAVAVLGIVIYLIVSKKIKVK